MRFKHNFFPKKPIFPGVLIIEAMAQTSAALVVHTLGKASEGKLVYFMSVQNARFRKFLGNDPKVLALGNFSEMTPLGNVRETSGNIPSSQLPASECASDLWAAKHQKCGWSEGPLVRRRIFFLPIG